MASNPIQSHDLYTPGGQDTLALLKKQLNDLQDEMRQMTILAKNLKTALAGTPAGSSRNIVDAATQTERLRQAQERTRQAYQRTSAAMARAAAAQHRSNAAASAAAAAAHRVTTAQTQAAIAAQRLANAQAAANRQTTSARSSFSGLLGSIRNLTYAYFTLGAAQQIVSKLFNETKALNTLDIALKQTLGSIQNVTEAKEFLLDITERYGADLLTTSNAYLKFGTAAKQAGVSAQDTRNIFESVTKASSVLGLGAERTSYVFLALEQIMSKGRLSTEELRRQLGEHLPGAFGIAAKAMNVTTAELTDMLKKGEIASTDFLPKFAKELEKTYGIENLNRVDNLAAAQGRFNNEITLLIRELDVAGFFKDFFDTMASGVKFVRENVEAFLALGKALVYVGAAWAAWKIGAAITSLGSMTRAVTLLNAALKANPIGAIAGAVLLLAGAIDLMVKKMNAAEIANKAFNDATTTGVNSTKLLEVQVNQLAAAYADENKSAKEKAKILKTLNELGIEANDINKDGKITTDELTASIEKQIKALQLKGQTQRLEALYEGINNQIADLQTKGAVPNIGLIGSQLASIDAVLGTSFSLSGQTENILKLKEAAKLIEAQLRELYGARLNGAGVDGTTPPGGDPTDPSGKDPRLVEIERLKYLNSLRKDSLAKDLEALSLNIAEKQIMYEKDAEVLKALEEYKWREVLAIREKYIGKEEELQAAQTEELLKGLEKIGKVIGDAFFNRAVTGYLEPNPDAMKKEFDQRREHLAAMFELEKHTEEELQAFKLKQQADELNDEIQLHRIFGNRLNDEELARAIELRDAILAQFSKDGKLKVGGKKESEKEGVDIFSLLGINFGGDTEKQDAFREAISTVGNELRNFYDLQKELIDQQIEDTDRLVRAKEEALNREVELAAAGQANNVATAQAELALAKRTQEEAIKQRKKIQKQEIILDTISQTESIVTAIAGALKLGPILGPIAVGAILATFAAAKIKAFQLVNKKTYRKGGFAEIGGGSHESGNDTHVGGNNWAEKNESVGIFNQKATRKYKPTLKAFVNAANKGTLEQIMYQDRRAIQGITNNYGPKVDTSLMEKKLTRLVQLNESQTLVDAQGRLITIDRGRKTIRRGKH